MAATLVKCLLLEEILEESDEGETDDDDKIKSKKYSASVSHMIDTGAKYYHYTFRRGQQLAPATKDISNKQYAVGKQTHQWCLWGVFLWRLRDVCWISTGERFNKMKMELSSKNS
jgi:hypothetical protein